MGTRARARYWWVLGLGQDTGGYYRGIGEILVGTRARARYCMVGTRARARYWWVLGLGQDTGGY